MGLFTVVDWEIIGLRGLLDGLNVAWAAMLVLCGLSVAWAAVLFLLGRDCVRSTGGVSDGNGDVSKAFGVDGC